VTAVHSALPLAPGSRLDRYELLCPIAEGGMASVWVARQSGKHGFEKLVAIKTILPKFATDVRFQEMFLDEARIASRIEHVNVAQIFDLGEEHDILYLAMEYVDGDSLSKLNRACQRRGVKIPTSVILRVLADTCAGLHEAHELKDGVGRALEIVHRDVSPHNILVSTKGVAKLIDFGIAKARSRMGSDTNSGVLKGKIAYMAPEQALGHSVDRRADLWAVGAILYHLLAGRPPYEGDNQLATLHLLGSGRPPMPLPSSVHPAIAGIVRKALTFSADGRSSTAAEMRDTIEQGMVAARMTATTADVAAFAAQYLSDRAEKRRYAIDVALAAAADRKRLEDLVDEGGKRRLALPPPISSVPLPPTSSPSLPYSRDLQTLAESPEAMLPPIELVAKLTPRLSEAPQPSSYATLGSAAFDASVPMAPAPRSRRGLVALAFVLLGATAVVAGMRFNVLPAGLPLPTANAPAAPVSKPPVPRAAATQSPPAPVTPETLPQAPPAASESTWAILPTVAATALPKANGPNTPGAADPAGRLRPSSPTRWTPRKPQAAQPAEPGETQGPEPAPAPPPAAAPAPPSPSPKSGGVDDGF
jgi:serine/threonine-protein kinase